ncbi:hypothetical protein BDN72DRAFT_757888 [Pluteus cervinus]|uniref:Uncharacterized protein n=1 Tax=Pluteus cervinus TaxID=181527 RepID=A0ACD3BEG6_9AGAR|nr:hypothetical protein BDN72DRAFT_757888 [Pluteus cervinus]
MPQLPKPLHPLSRSKRPRPLPKVPLQPVACKYCRTCITSSKVLVHPDSFPNKSRRMRGFNGKASLFTEVSNVHLSAPTVQLMTTGAHTIQEITCSTCTTYLGWKIVRAHERTEQWKEGICLLEVESLFTSMVPPPSPTYPMEGHWRSPSSGSDTSSGSSFDH